MLKRMESERKGMPLWAREMLRFWGMAVMLGFLAGYKNLFFGLSLDTRTDVVPPLEDERARVYWFLAAVTVVSGIDALRGYLRKERWKGKKRYAFAGTWGATVSIVVIYLNGMLSFFEVELINNPYLYSKVTLPFHVLGWTITAFMYFILVFAVNSISLGMTLGNWLFAVWGIVNYFVCTFRGLPLQWIDFGSVETAIAVSGSYHFTLTWQIVAVITLTAAVTGFYIHAGFWHNFRTIPCRILSRAIAAAAAVAFWALFLRSDFLASTGMQLSPWAPERGYLQYGMETSFLSFAKASIPEAPDSYSKENVARIISHFQKNKASTQENEENAPENIIFIMDESFADFSVYPHFHADTDPMPFLHSMAENAQSGSMLVSVKGGNTANTEYEALTGNSCEFSPSTVVYNSFIKQDQFALPRILKAQGYRTVALHPFHRYGWNRPLVYERMGFDEFLSLENYFEGAETVRDYVSDKADFEALVRLVKEKPAGQKLFLFNVTMQNHGQYKTANFASTVHVPEFNGENKGQAEQYLTLSKMTDEAVEELVSYFQRTTQKTMIVFWGDHQPMIGDDFWEYCLGVNNLDGISFEERQLMYRTRFFIWANYDIPEASDLVLSTNYLSSYVLSLTGLQMTDYQKYLLQQRKLIPAMNAYGYLGTDGTMHEWGSADAGAAETARLDDYNNLICNELTGGKNRDTTFFSLP